jgi:hypothetical protein
MQLSFPVFEGWSWPWPEWTLHVAYLASGVLIAAHYLPQVRLAWSNPEATRAAQSLFTWLMWTGCRGVALAYGVFVIHELLFLLVVVADLVGRLAMVASIIRARVISPRMQQTTSAGVTTAA